MELHPNDFVMPILGCLASIVGWAVMGFLSKMEKSFAKLTESVERLNLNVAVIVEQVQGHDRRIARLESDLSR